MLKPDEVPETLYGLWWVCDYTGDVPADQLQVASADPDDPRFAKAGETTYDGLSMSSQGTFVLRTHPRPKSVTTLLERFGDRVRFDLAALDVGCWIDGSPHRFDHGTISWTWNREERDYLWALVTARSGLSFMEMLNEAV